MLRYSILKNVRGASAKFSFVQLRGLHSRNKTAMQFLGIGIFNMNEVDRVIDHCERNDVRLTPQLRLAKENFELALEADNSNTQARFLLAKLHLYYHVPQACKAVGAALLLEAAEMGDADALYELGSCLRRETDHVQAPKPAFYYIMKATERLHPKALFLLGAVYLTGECAQQDIGSAIWCFHRASEKEHAGAAIAYGALLLQGHQIPESIAKFNVKKRSKTTKRNYVGVTVNNVEKAKEQFQIAASAGCDLGFSWLLRLEEEEKRLSEQ